MRFKVPNAGRPDAPAAPARPQGAWTWMERAAKGSRPLRTQIVPLASARHEALHRARPMRKVLSIDDTGWKAARGILVVLEHLTT